MCCKSLHRWSGVLAAGAVFTCFHVTVNAQDFVNDVNGLHERTYLFQCCDSDLAITDNYPALAKFDEQFNSGPVGADFANRHEFLFSTNGGATARTFNNNDSFDVSVDVMLEAGENIPRKEAGLRMNRSFQDGRFIVTTNEGTMTTGEIVAFGGPLPFFSFDDTFGIRYTVGTTITLRMIYNEPGPDPMNVEADKGTIQYLVDYMGNSYDSGVIPFSNLESGIVNGNVIGTYMQATPSTSNPSADFGISTFTNFVFGNGETGLDGDFNNDGTVDAADYVVWRKEGLPEEDYNTWRTNFGRSGGGGGGGAVPEPATALLVLLGAIGCGLIRRR